MLYLIVVLFIAATIFGIPIAIVMFPGVGILGKKAFWKEVDPSSEYTPLPEVVERIYRESGN